MGASRASVAGSGAWNCGCGRREGAGGAAQGRGGAGRGGAGWENGGRGGGRPAGSQTTTAAAAAAAAAAAQRVQEGCGGGMRDGKEGWWAEPRRVAVGRSVGRVIVVREIAGVVGFFCRSDGVGIFKRRGFLHLAMKCRLAVALPELTASVFFCAFLELRLRARCAIVQSVEFAWMVVRCVPGR